MASAKTVESLLSKCEIPIIDLAHIGTDTCPMRSVVRRVGRELHAALKEKGLALLVNHGISDEKLKAVYSDLDNLCALPKDSQQLYSSSPSIESGYSTPELELSEGNDRGNDNGNDKKELQYSFNITSLSQECMPTEEQVPHFLEHASPLARDFTNLSRLLLNALALALDLPVAYLVERHSQMLKEDGTNTSCMSLLYHPPVPPSDHARDENAITRCLPHRDTDTLTLVAQDCEGGFEVKLPSTHKWQAVGHLPGSLLVYSGELLAGWTANMYPALVSRVIVPEQPYVRSRGRHSISFYCRPDAGAQVCCPLAAPTPTAAVVPVVCHSSRSLHHRFINVCHQVQKRFKETYA